MKKRKKTLICISHFDDLLDLLNFKDVIVQNDLKPQPEENPHICLRDQINNLNILLKRRHLNSNVFWNDDVLLILEPWSIIDNKFAYAVDGYNGVIFKEFHPIQMPREKIRMKAKVLKSKIIYKDGLFKNEFKLSRVL